MNLAKLIGDARRILHRVVCLLLSGSKVAYRDRAPSKEKHGADLYQVCGLTLQQLWILLFSCPAYNEEEWGPRLLDDLMTAQGRFYYAIADKDR